MFRNLLERLKATPPWVWITIVLAAVGVVISFLIYRNGVNTSTADTSGQAGTSGGVNPGDTSGGYSPYGNNSSQYQPDYSTQSLLQQMVNLLQGLQPKPGTPAPSPSPSPVPSPTPSPIHLPPVVPGGAQQPIVRTRPTVPVSAPPVVPHPVLPPPQSPAPVPVRRTSSPVPARQQPDYVIGSVNHADGHVGTQPHPGAISITVPHPLQQRQMGF